MGFFEDLFEKAREANESAVDSLNAGADRIGGLFGRGSSTASAKPVENVSGLGPFQPEGYDAPESSTERDLVRNLMPKTPYAVPTLSSSKSSSSDIGTRNLEATLRGLNADAAFKEAQTKKILDELAQEKSEDRKALLQLQLDKAKIDLRKAEKDLDDALNGMSPEKQIRLQDELATARERLRQDFEAAKSDKEFERIWAREEAAAQREAARDDRKFGHDLELDARRGARESASDQLRLGVTVRGQELDRLKAQDDFALNMLKAQIDRGNLSLNKATNLFEAYVTKARLPAQIMADVGKSVEPLLPYMTSSKAGDIPLGFESGGSRDVIGRLGGNAPGSYNPSQYAVKPVEVDPFKLAKQAGADFKGTKVPDPGKAFAGIGIPNVPTGGTSATAGIGPISQYTGQIANQQQAMGLPQGIAAAASPMPPGIGPTDQEREQMKKAIGL